ncbi:hypothetical protein ACLOJK_004331 [Asimina triloba]
MMRDHSKQNAGGKARQNRWPIRSQQAFFKSPGQMSPVAGVTKPICIRQQQSDDRPSTQAKRTMVSIDLRLVNLHSNHHPADDRSMADPRRQQRTEIAQPPCPTNIINKAISITFQWATTPGGDKLVFITAAV